jgi:hypothetical protein
MAVTPYYPNAPGLAWRRLSLCGDDTIAAKGVHQNLDPSITCSKYFP